MCSKLKNYVVDQVLTKSTNIYYCIFRKEYDYPQNLDIHKIECTKDQLPGLFFKNFKSWADHYNMEDYDYFALYLMGTSLANESLDTPIPEGLEFRDNDELFLNLFIKLSQSKYSFESNIKNAFGGGDYFIRIYEDFDEFVKDLVVTFEGSMPHDGGCRLFLK